MNNLIENEHLLLFISNVGEWLLIDLGAPIMVTRVVGCMYGTLPGLSRELRALRSRLEIPPENCTPKFQLSYLLAGKSYSLMKFTRSNRFTKDN